MKAETNMIKNDDLPQPERAIACPRSGGSGGPQKTVNLNG
jgi:hypothetical protein